MMSEPTMSRCRCSQARRAVTKRQPSAEALGAESTTFIAPKARHSSRPCRASSARFFSSFSQRFRAGLTFGDGPPGLHVRNGVRSALCRGFHLGTLLVLGLL